MQIIIIYVQHKYKVNSRKYVVKRYKHIFLRPSETCVDVEKITYYCKRACSFIIDIISLYRYYLELNSYLSSNLVMKSLYEI